MCKVQLPIKPLGGHCGVTVGSCAVEGPSPSDDAWDHRVGGISKGVVHAEQVHLDVGWEPGRNTGWHVGKHICTWNLEDKFTRARHCSRLEARSPVAPNIHREPDRTARCREWGRQVAARDIRHRSPTRRDTCSGPEANVMIHQHCETGRTKSVTN